MKFYLLLCLSAMVIVCQAQSLLDDDYADSHSLYLEDSPQKRRTLIGTGYGGIGGGIGGGITGSAALNAGLTAGIGGGIGGNIGGYGYGGIGVGGYGYPYYG